jgi:hypothetical protein
MLARNFYSKLVCFHLGNQAKEVHHHYLEIKRKKAEEELRKLEEENKKKTESQKKFQDDMKKQIELDNTVIKPVSKYTGENREMHGGIRILI